MNAHPDTNVIPFPNPQSNISSSRWLKVLSQSVAAFYTKPLMAKWLKTFKNPDVLLLSLSEVDTQPWQKRLKPQHLTWTPLATVWAGQFPESWGHYDCLIIEAEAIETRHLSMFTQAFKPGGCLVIITRNLSSSWLEWQNALEQADFVDPFPIGFHPKGVLCWWPTNDIWLTRWIGLLLHELWAFFPGRSQAYRRFAPCWAFRVLKRNDITRLTPVN